MSHAVIVVGLGFGDEGKGTIVDAVCREIGATMVVRYNGGAQAAHRVELEDGRSHVFAQFGAGTFAGAATYLSRFMFVEPFALVHEADFLTAMGIHRPLGLIFLDGEAPIITPYHRALCRLREWARGEARHGSCGVGVGETASDIEKYPHCSLYAKDLSDPDVTRKVLGQIYERKRVEALTLRPFLPDHMGIHNEMGLFETTATGFAHQERIARWIERYQRFADQVTILEDPVDFRAHRNIVFEGAQGVLLDELYGFHPHTTWTNCTLDNALSLLCQSNWRGAVTKIGVTRTYATRHGHGPFPTEDRRLTFAADPHNGDGPFQGPFRVGHLDTVLLRYAKAMCRHELDGLAVTHVDALRTVPHVALATRYGAVQTHLPDVSSMAEAAALTDVLFAAKPHYRAFTGEHRVDKFLSALADEVKLPILIESVGPIAAAKRWTPQWRQALEVVPA